jgi:hypothetical protein
LDNFCFLRGLFGQLFGFVVGNWWGWGVTHGSYCCIKHKIITENNLTKHNRSYDPVYQR